MKKFNSYLMLFVLAAAMIVAALPVDVHAQGDLVEVEIQGDAAAMKDAQITSSGPTSNFGTLTQMGVGESNGAASVQRSLLQFDLSGLPSDLEVVSATLTLTVDEDFSDNARTMQAYPIKIARDWVEAQVTWNSYKTSNNWGTAGASAASDVDASIGSVAVASDLAAGALVTMTLDPSAVQDMAHLDYYGFELRMNTENNDMYKFRTSDQATSTDRPKLVIEYYPDTPVPDPGWKCYEGTFGAELITWPDCAPGGAGIPPVMSPFMASGVQGSQGSQYAIAATLQCTPWPQCQNNYPVYYRVTYDVSWTTSISTTGTLHTKMVVAGGFYNDINTTCGTGTAGECFGVLEGTVPAASLPVNADQGYTVGLSEQLLFTGLPAINTYSIAWSVYWSLEPFDQECADTWFVPVPDTFTIDPTVDVPVGYPTDTQIYTTVPDQVYMARVQNGPWNDGTNDRTDAEVSINGGLTWLSWDEFSIGAVCVDTNETNPDYTAIYFTAVDEEFMIRVADTAGNFGDNTNDGETPFEYVIGIAFENTAAAACESQFSYDPINDVIASITVQGTDDDAQATDVDTSPLEAGGWYGIEVASGTWNETGGADRIDMDFMFGGGIGGTDWVDLAEGSDLVDCQTEDGTIVFIQAPGNAELELHLRVNDQDDPVNFTDNEGSLSVNIYHASFDRLENGCELQFEPGGLLKHDSVEGNQSAGKAFGTYPNAINLVYYNGEPLISIPRGDKALVPGGWYMLETVEGPWWQTVTIGDKTTNTHYYDMEIKVGDGDWEPLEEWSDAECVVPTDTLGHVRVYFQVPEDSTMGDDEYMLRVDSSAFMFSRGHMAWDLYSAMDWGYTGATGNCDNYNYDPDAPHMIGQIDADLEAGGYINGLAVGQVFAIQIESADGGSGWFESTSSSTELDGLQLAVNGEDFQTLPDAAGVLCYYNTPVDDELVFFVRPQNGEAWKMRADSTTFSNNTGVEKYTVFEASAGNLNTWDSCIDDYQMHIPPLNPHDWIDVTKSEGEKIVSLAQYAEYTGLLAPDAQLPPEIWKDTDALGNYIVEIEYGTGPWDDGETDTQHYDAELSKDGGTTWERIDADMTIATCTASDPLRMYWKAFIQVETGDVWMIRVADSNTDTFIDNTGNLAYILYSAGGFEVPPPDNSNIGAVNVQGGGDICLMDSVSPGALALTDIDELGNYFGEWIGYLSYSITRFLAFCPRHTDMFFSVFDLLKKKEPFATLAELDAMTDDIIRELEAYGWDAQGGDLSFIWGTKTPSQIQNLVDQYVFEGQSDPWADDALLLPNGMAPTAMPSSYAACKALFPDYKRFADGLCFASAWMKETSASFWIQLGFDVGAMLLVISIIWASLLDVISMFTGVPLARGSGLQRTVVNIMNGREK